jgi:hypothetical protein
MGQCIKVEPTRHIESKRRKVQARGILSFQECKTITCGIAGLIAGTRRSEQRSGGSNIRITRAIAARHLEPTLISLGGRHEGRQRHYGRRRKD